jgi:hypothetical protein
MFSDPIESWRVQFPAEQGNPRSMQASQDNKLGKGEFERRSQFLYRLRLFLRIAEDAAREAGITTQKHQLLLHTQGLPGREWVSVGELAERLPTPPNGAATMVSRCERAGLVRRRVNDQDHRVSDERAAATADAAIEMPAQACA